MASFLDRLTGRNRPSSAHIAKERLKLVLVTDRSNLPQERLEAMQAEILEVIKRYMDIDEPQIAMKFEQRDRTNYLVADIPLHRDRSYQAGDRETPPAEASDSAQPAPIKAKIAPPKTAPPKTRPSKSNRTNPRPPKGKAEQAPKTETPPAHPGPEDDELPIFGDE